MINNNIYPSVWTVTYSHGIETDTIKLADTIAKLAHDGRLMPNTLWDSSNVYAVFNPKAKGLDTTFSYISKWVTDVNNINHITTTVITVNSKVNLRLAALNVSGNTYRWAEGIKWTGVSDGAATELKKYQASHTVSFYNPSTRGTQNLTFPGQHSFTYQNFPVTDIRHDKLLILPYFWLLKYTFTYTGDAITGYTQTSKTTVDWATLKPADNTAAGTSYNSELYEKGYYFDYDDAGKPIAMTLISGANLQNYIGSAGNRTASWGASSGGPSNVSGSTLGTTNIVVIAEIHNPDDDSVYYTTLPGFRHNTTVNNNTAVACGFFSDAMYQVIPSGTTTALSLGGTVIRNTYANSGTNAVDNFMVYKNLDPEEPFTWYLMGDAPELDVTNDMTGVGYTYTIDTGAFIQMRRYGYASAYSTIININAIPYPIPLRRLWQTLAATGLYICGSTAHVQDALGASATDYIYIGNMTDSGETDGTMLQGSAIADAPHSKWTSINDNTTIPYVPSPEESDDELTTAKHNDETSLPVLSGIRTVSGDAFSTFYHLSMYHIAEMGQLISQMPQSFWEALGTATDYKQSNLLDYLVSLKWYPLNLTDSTDTVTSDLQFGFNGTAKITFTAAGTSYRIGNINRVYDMGSLSVPYRSVAQSFLDLEPYTTVSAYLPYIGTVSLQANDVVGHLVTCTYIIDLTTGMCTGLLDNGVDTIYIGTGKIGVDISVSGNDVLTQSEKMASSYIGAAAGAVNNTLALTAAAASGKAELIASTSVTDLATAAISIANNKRGIPESVGSASGFGGGYTHQSPYITVKRPAVSIPGRYGHDIGYVCNRTYIIGSLSGFTVCENPDLSGIPATASELDMIKSILCTGFYA